MTMSVSRCPLMNYCYFVWSFKVYMGEFDNTFSGKKKDVVENLTEILKTTAIVLGGMAGFGSSAGVNTVSITYDSHPNISMAASLNIASVVTLQSKCG